MSNGQTVGRWVLQEEIARGGMGAVYRALDPETGREAALKLVVDPERGDRLRRFEREVEAIARLEHPNIVAAFEAGVAAGRPFLAMELVHGETLSQRLEREGPLGPRAAAELALTLAAALRYAHEQGVLHRDLKPDNVLLHPGLGAVLTDFGLARDLDDGQSLLTHSGVGLGTPGFWAPEQAVGAKDTVGPRSDVYGLGATLYAALTGEGPHSTAEGFHATMVATLTQAPRPPGVDPALDMICLRCLEKTPESRYSSMEDLEAALRAYLSGELRPRPRRRIAVALAITAVLLLVAGSAALVPWWRERLAEERRAEAKGLSAQALTAYRAGRFEEAAALYERSIGLRPLATVYYNRGMCLLAARLDEEAIASLDSALGLDPNHLPAWLARGEAHNRNGRPVEGLASFEQVLRIDPNHGQGHVGKGSALHDLERFEASEAAYTRAIVIDGALFHAWAGRAATRERRGDVRGALSDYTEAGRLQPEDAGLLVDRSRLQLRLHMGPEAAAGFTRAIELLGESAGLCFSRGQARLLPPLSDLDGAIEDFERALALTKVGDASVDTIRSQLDVALQVRAGR